MVNDPYRILGVTPEAADDDSIRRAYLEGLRAHPPERDPAGFQRLREAYDKLSTHKRRVAHALFDVDMPDVAAVTARALAPGKPRRPSAATLRAALRDGLKPG